MRVALVVTAAGSSLRMGGGEKKEYRLLGGKPVLLRTVHALLATGVFGHAVITVPAGHSETVRSILESMIDGGMFTIVSGGATRRESVYNGLKALEAMDPEWVLIHDGARPWIDGAVVERVLAGAKLHGAAIPVVDVSDALKVLSADGMIREHLKKTHIKGAQTPQGFDYKRIFTAHCRAHEQNMDCDDDAQVFEHFAGPVHTVPGNPENRKITYSHDMD